MRLHEFKTGQKVTIESLDASYPRALRHRLMALGFVPGTLVEVRHRAPLGDPTEYALRGARVSLRAAEARMLEVREVVEPASQAERSNPERPALAASS